MTWLSPFYRAYEWRLMRQVNNGSLPKHVGIILDGNRRFAQEKGLTISEGHELGVKKLEEVLDWCLDLDIKVMTVYAFSLDNFQRSNQEVYALMELFKQNFDRIVTENRIHENRVKIRAIGRTDHLPRKVKEAIQKAEKATAEYDGHILNIAVGYCGRHELTDAFRKMAQKVLEKKLDPAEITEEVVKEHLYTADLPDPDLIIRTSGEERLSGFLLWQSAYSELYFCDVYWPAFRKIDFLRAIRSFQQRERRFGR